MARKKILVVDDDREWNFLLKMRLEYAGLNAEQAYNGKEALEKIKHNKPDLVILDIAMPEMDGWEVSHQIRMHKETKELPIIIVSSISKPEDVEQGKSYQIKRYLIKPCLPQTVIQTTLDILRG